MEYMEIIYMKMFMFQHQTPGIAENSREGKARTCRLL